MCILCVIQKWSRRVATMLPWLVIPLIVLWALSQLLPPAFRFEITSPRLGCVLVLLVTLLWYEILMPKLSTWMTNRSARLREKKRFEAIEMEKMRKSATRRCRNCLTPYKDQNPGGGKFMCLYCGHISKRPVLDLPVPPGMGSANNGILKELVRKSGRMLNGKVWSDNGWTCGQDWLDNSNWGNGSFEGKSSYWSNNNTNGGLFGTDDHCLAEKSYSSVFVFFFKAFMAFVLSIRWLWRKIFRVNSSDPSIDAERRGLMDKRGDNVGNGLESKGEKARRKAEEKRQARLERELLEEEERKQREEVAWLVEEQRRLRDEAEKEHGKGSVSTKERDSKKETEKKKTSSKCNSDAEEMEKRSFNRKNENDKREHHRVENVKTHVTDVTHGYKGSSTINSNNHSRVNGSGGRYFDRVKGTFLSSSRAFTGGSFFGRESNVSVISREHNKPNTPNTPTDHFQNSATKRDLSQIDRGKLDENKNIINRPVFIEPPQVCTAPKKSWQQLFTRSPTNTNVISRPRTEVSVQSPPFTPSKQSFETLSSPFSLPSFSLGSTSNNNHMLSEAMFPRLGETPVQYLPLPEESEIFEDPCYDPDPVSLLGPVSESLDNFQLDLGFVGDIGMEKMCCKKSVLHTPSELNRPSPIESPISRARIPEERHNQSSFLFPNNLKSQDMRNTSLDGSSNDGNEIGTWQMWSSSPLGPDSLGLLRGSASLFSPQEMNIDNNINNINTPKPHVAHKTMASLFSKDDQGKGYMGNTQNNGEDPWLMKKFHVSDEEINAQNGRGGFNGSPRAVAANNQFDMSTANPWGKKERNVQVQVQQGSGGGGDGVGNSSPIRPSIGGLYSTQDVQSVWSV